MVRDLSMKVKTTHQRIVKEGVYKDVRRLFTPTFSTLTSQKHNARYTGLDMLNMTLGVAVMNKFVSPAYNSMRNSDTKVEIEDPIWEGLESDEHDTSINTNIPTPHWLFDRLKQYTPEHLFEQGDQMIIATVQRCIKAGMLKKAVTVAIDGHNIPCHSNNEELTIKSKPKGGTSKMEAYVTIQIVDDVRLTLAALSHTKDDNNAGLVRRTIGNVRDLSVKVKRLLLDRGYYSVNVLKVLREMRVPYIMMVKKSKPIQRLVKDYHNGVGKQTVQYTVKSKNGSERIRLLIVKRKDADSHKKITDKYVVLAYRSRRKKVKDIIADIPEEYRKRWGIETGYRNIGFMRAKTRSMIPGVRQFLFLFSAAVANLWTLANYGAVGAKDGIVTPTITIEFFKEHLLQIISMIYKIVIRIPKAPD